MPLARLIGTDFAAIILAGLGGDFIWQWWPAHRSQMRAGAAAGLLLALCVIALTERWGAYQLRPVGMESTARRGTIPTFRKSWRPCGRLRPEEYTR